VKYNVVEITVVIVVVKCSQLRTVYITVKLRSRVVAVGSVDRIMSSSLPIYYAVTVTMYHCRYRYY